MEGCRQDIEELAIALHEDTRQTLGQVKRSMQHAVLVTSHLLEDLSPSQAPFAQEGSPKESGTLMTTLVHEVDHLATHVGDQVSSFVDTFKFNLPHSSHSSSEG